MLNCLDRFVLEFWKRCCKVEMLALTETLTKAPYLGAALTIEACGRAQRR